MLTPSWFLLLLLLLLLFTSTAIEVYTSDCEVGEAGLADLGPYPTPVCVPTTSLVHREDTGGEAGATSCKYWTTTRWRSASMQQVIFHLLWSFTGAIQDKQLAYNSSDQHCVIVYTLQIVWFIRWEVWGSDFRGDLQSAIADCTYRVKNISQLQSVCYRLLACLV